MSCPSLIVFGSQTTWPSSQYLSQLRNSLVSQPRLHAFTDSIKQLPQLWQTLLESNPRLHRVPGRESLNYIKQWIDCGEFPLTAEPLPSILSTPMTIIIHIVQYLDYLENNRITFPTHSLFLTSLKPGGVQGLCTGLLTAVAVACSKNEEDINEFGAVALRLAVCIGAYVDLDGAYATPPNQTCWLAVRWKEEVDRERVSDVLKGYPDAYVSVLLDPTSVTITIPKPDFDSLSQQLSVKGLKVKPVGLTGRFHSTAHSKSVARILDLCASNPSLQFPPASSLLVPLRSNSDAQVIINGSLHETALKAILAELADWHLTISGAISQLTQFGTPRVLQVGLVDSIPSSIIRDHGLKTIKMGPSKLLSSGLTGIGSMPSSGIATPAFKGSPDGRYPSHAIAVVGMACKFPGADSIDEFWQIITAGTSMCEQMPSERFSMEGLRRSPDNKLKFWGNFVRDIDAFDHKFFKKSSREAASMDPQQRLLLQVAYQALESAGYFGELGSSQADDIGVYLGVCANDYNDNVASHSPNAYSSLGTLRAFLSGKISHFFGWTSPSITYDTACSSSAVAIHAACKALQTGDCSRAVAGGASLYTSPNFYQNLAAASFLSPTGPTKPFDAKGDGYCRGEGIGLVVLKRLSDAIADGDTVMGVIGGIAVNQNKNSTSITVPHGESQMALYEKVASQAGVNPKDVSFVEAHGTGTPVGDPIEFESIRKVFGGSERSQPLHIASVKGNIGHLEGASGVAALMKTVLMMRHSTIPVQANFSTLNPKISSLDVDMVAIPTWTQKWESTFQIACINNYGAAGSNAAMIVCQPTSEMSTSLGQKLKLPHVSLPKYPLFISANSPTSLSAYCAALQEKLPQLSSGLLEKDVIPSITFNLADKQNRSLPHLLATTVSSLAELKTQLNDGAAGSSTSQSETSSKAKPVVLVFGGQVNNAIGLSKDVYESSVLLRSHLDHCDKALRSAGLKGLYPHIFRAEPVEDIVNLHTMLFSLQYACAKSWMDSGLKVDALVGHSFGQLTALCVSGGLSLNDGIKLIAGRAALMQKFWGIERGSMISVEAELDIVLDLVSSINQAGSHHKVEIACYNGPTSHVLVGTEASINAVEDELVHHVGPIKYKKLNVTHGFHSEFTEPLLPSLKKISEELVFRDPHIPLETCSETESWLRAEPKLIAEHTRTPVYFGKAVERLAQRLGSCSWLEAGSAASVTSMVRRALGTTESPSHSFHPVNLTASGGMGSLADITVNLWKAGHKVQFWPFHRSQKHEYSPLSLPPYQFEKSRHWLTWLDSATGASAIPRPKTETGEPTLLTFIKYLDQNQRQAVFCVDPRSEEYKLYVQGHAVLAEPLCPAPLYVELVSQAAMVLNAGSGSLTYIPCVEDLEIKAPLGMNDRAISILLKRADVVTSTWDFELSSQSRGNGSTKIAVQQHATGKVSLETGNPKLMADFDRYERLIGDRRYNDLVADPEAEAMRGALVYKVFGKVVTYKDYYKGVRSVYAKDQEVAGLVTLPSHDIKALQNTVCNPLAVDNFVQVSGLHVNSLNEIGDNEVFICTKIDRIQPSPKFKQAEVDTRAWIVYSSFQRTSDKELVNDIFVFNSKSKSLVMIILGVRFTKVLISSLAKVLSRANIDGGETATAGAPHSSATVCGLPEESPVLPALTSFDSNQSRVIMCGSGPAVDVDLELQKLIHKVTEVPMDAFTNKSTLEELGIDSLMITEVLGEMRTVFEVDIPAQDLLNLADIKSLSDYLRSKGVGSSGQDQSFPRTDSDSDSMTSTSSGMMSGTPPTPMSTRNTYVAHVSQLPTDTQKSAPLAVAPLHNAPAIQLPAPASGQSTCLVGAQQVFQQIRYDYDIYTKQTGFANFWEKVYPTQTRLVLAYIVEAFATCGCPLASLQPGQKLPPVTYLPKHSMLMAQLYEILKDGNLIYSKDSEFVRSDTPVDKTPSATIYGEILRAFPQHASEHQLLHITGSAFGDCLTGAADPLQLLFRSKANKEILEDVYTNGPMYKAISKLLGSYLGKAFANPLDGGKFHILEVGGGTGGTTKYIVDFLIRQGVPFSYTFTDISGSLVAAARKTFAGRDMMDFMVIDIEKEPAEKLRNHYHCIISTNCIHATRNLTLSTQHMRQMLRPDGFVSLVEFTRNIYWFDLVFGLLEGWWLFEDGRKHVLTNEWFWNNSMRSAGFKHVTWTDGRSEEARTLRIITGFAAEAESDMLKPKKAPLKLECETVVYKRVGNNSLLADIYYPHDTSVAKRPIALLIHGGGHVMFTRKEVHPKQVRLLLDNGFLPVSVEYRFCPEINIIDGPMTDVCDALHWCRETLPTMKLSRPGLQIDGNRVAVVGWSTGGHLAMTIPSTAIQRGIKPPDAVLAFYAPLVLESDWWRKPIYPAISVSSPSEEYDLLEGVRDEPIADYYPPSNRDFPGQMMTIEDPRWRFVLHMNWQAQTLPVLLNGLPSKKQLAGGDPKSFESLPMPPLEKVLEISPHAQIVRGAYNTPTFLIHGTADELIPWEHSQLVVNALTSRGIPAGIYLLEGAAHLFDTFPPSSGYGQEAIQAGYEFLFSQIQGSE